MKKNLALLLITISAFAATGTFSQNIDRDNISVKLVQLPLKKLPDTTETYFSEIKEAKSQLGNSFGGAFDGVPIKLNGYYQLPSSYDADIVVTAGLRNGLLYKEAKVYTNTYTYKKDKNSPEIKYTAYSYAVSFTSPEIFYSIKAGNGATIEESTVGGGTNSESFGNSDYSSYYKSEYELSSAWRQVQRYKLAEWEQRYYKNALYIVPAVCNEYCLIRTNNSFAIKYVKEKKSNQYDDLRQAKILLEEGAGYTAKDSIVLINRLVQPEYDKMIETINKAIAIWDKALLEADFKDKKARIDQKVARHLFYNIAVAYALTGNYDKAQQYLQGRQDEETDNVLLKNTFAGIKALSAFIDEQKLRSEANKWRAILKTNDFNYTYKDPAQRQKEYDDALKAEIAKQKIITDSIEAAEKKTKPAVPVKKTKPAVPAKKPAAKPVAKPAVKPKNL